MSRRDASDALIEALLNPALFGAEVEKIRLVETHISWVLLTGRHAYKIKKPIRLPFLDFTTLPARRHYCEEELRLNRRLAPELYLDVVPIGGSRKQPRIGEEPAIEYAVRMREFPSDARLDRCISHDRIGSADIGRFAETIGQFHASLPAAAPDAAYGTADAVLALVARNLDETSAAMSGALDADDALREYLTGGGSPRRGALDMRRQQGSIREGHGDLHLENLAYWDDRIVAFDALEFDPALRWIDVIDEAAFVTMDLIAHGRRDLAFCFLNRYLEITGDYSGLELLPFYMVHRALVRAKVRAIKAEQEPRESSVAAPRRYLDVTAELLASTDRRLLITHGLSGSGKTTLTQRLVELLPAVRVRSDVERKRRSGLDERAASHSPLGRGLYTPASTDATYSALARWAEIGLQAGFDVIVDATFLQHAQRQWFASLAARAQARFTILDFQASDRVLRDRLTARRREAKDASEATIDVLDYQLAHRESLTSTERRHTVTIDTEEDAPMEGLVERIRAI
ncbi:MAG TPA: AAA family ATPase [Gammaproteobacteria bacterium]|nr:AAA family ATPase [Gammaproteobacteria bacterium]